MSTKSKLVGLMAMSMALGINPNPVYGEDTSHHPFKKICKQCGEKFSNRGKICSECFEANGNAVKPPTQMEEQG